MKSQYTARITAEIKADISSVWDALTNSELIKQYFYGTNAISDWKVGSPLVFIGSWEGKPYEDHGVILEIKKNELFRYNYWSSFSGKEDIPENYANISYHLSPKNGYIALTITQEGIESEEQKQHSEKNWETVLENMKKLIER